MDGLVTILADMLRSAITWEEEHMELKQAGKSDPAMPLNCVINGYTLETKESAGREDKNEHQGIN